MTDGSAQALLRAEGLWKTYPDGDVHALNGVSLAVREAEYVAITGPSGCGKSTLLNVLGALDRPDKGEVYFRGEPLSNRADLDRVSRPSDRVRLPVVFSASNAHRPRERPGAHVRGPATIGTRSGGKSG